MLVSFKVGDKVSHVALVKMQKMGSTATGGVFVRGSIQDNSGIMNFISFSQDIADFFKENTVSVLQVAGTIQADRYSQDGARQMMLEHVGLPPEEVDLSHLIPYTPRDIGEYQQKLQSLIESVTKRHLSELLREVFQGELFTRFSKNPAAMKHHHAYIGGLLEHSVDVAGMARAMAAQCDGIDVDLVITGSLLHDIGKIKEISPDIGFEYTDVGRFVGHLVLGAMMVEKAMAKVKDFPRQDAMELMHILLAHHGTVDKGSPVASSTRESLIVHYADEVNAVLSQFVQPDLGEKTEWQYNKMLGHQIFVRNNRS
ncbi:MAG TPA: HD domain-containing protein [Patescibacteria group bacterium]|nr:HD domain-containing protein [Patescibacteria group bacterium]